MINPFSWILEYLGWWPTGMEKRRFFRKRVDAGVIVEIYYKDEKGMHSYMAQLVDVSEAGAQLLTNHGRVDKGMTIVIKTSNKHYISSLSQEATVMWILKEGATIRFGVKYTQLVDTPYF